METARRLYRARRLRARHFSQGLFAEPTWDMLLDLFIADCEGRKLSVKSICIAAAVPLTTALRHLSWLTEQGLVDRLDHPHDARSVRVRLSSAGAAAMSAYLVELEAV